MRFGTTTTTTTTTAPQKWCKYPKHLKYLTHFPDRLRVVTGYALWRKNVQK